MDRGSPVLLFGLLLLGCGTDDDVSGIKVLGGYINQLTVERGADPDWSFDGSEIAYIRSQNIWLISAEGGDPVQISDDPGLDLRGRDTLLSE